MQTFTTNRSLTNTLVWQKVATKLAKCIGWISNIEKGNPKETAVFLLTSTTVDDSGNLVQASPLGKFRNRKRDSLLHYMTTCVKTGEARKIQEKYVVTKLKNTLKAGIPKIPVITANFEQRIKRGYLTHSILRLIG